MAGSSPLAALKRLSSSGLTLLLTRAEFASVELALARAQLMRWLGLALIGAGLGLLALMAISAVVTLVLWERAGPFTLLVLFVLYGVGAWIAVRRLQREMRDAPPLLSETLSELARDREALFGRNEAGNGDSAGPR